MSSLASTMEAEAPYPSALSMPELSTTQQIRARSLNYFEDALEGLSLAIFPFPSSFPLISFRAYDKHHGE